MDERIEMIRDELEADKNCPLTHIGKNTVFLLNVIDAYEIALNYFIKEGGQPAKDIVRNLLKEVEG